MSLCDCRQLLFPLAVVLGAASFALAEPVGHDCVLWIKADEGIATDLNGRITLAADLSGTAHDGSAGASEGPLLVASALNGRPVMRFGGNNWLSLSGQILTSQQYTIIAVVNDTRQDGGFHEIFSNWNFSNQGTSVFFGTTALNPQGPDTTRARLTDDVGGANQGQAGVGVVANRSSHFILTGISRTTNAEVYQNRTLIAGTEVPITLRNLVGPYVIGRQGPISEFWTGDIAEILIYNTALSRCELDAVYDSFNARYNLADCLPSITTQPHNTGICPGGTAQISIQSGGGLCDANFSYRWSKDGVPLDDTGAFSGTDTPQLTIANTTSAEEGLYTCTVTNACGSTPSDEATLALCFGDFDCDQDTDSDDITQFFIAWDNGDTAADTDLDGDTDSDDIIAFFSSWDSGC